MKGRRQDGQRRGRHHRRAQALSQPAPDQHPFATGEAAHERCDAKQRRPGNEQTPPAKQVSGAATEQQEPAIGEQVRTRDPLQILDREVQMILDLGYRDIHDRPIEKIDERDRGQQDKSELAPTRPQIRRWGRCCCCWAGRAGHGCSPRGRSCLDPRREDEIGPQKVTAGARSQHEWKPSSTPRSPAAEQNSREAALLAKARFQKAVRSR